MPDEKHAKRTLVLHFLQHHAKLVLRCARSVAVGTTELLLQFVKPDDAARRSLAPDYAPDKLLGIRYTSDVGERLAASPHAQSLRCFDRLALTVPQRVVL